MRYRLLILIVTITFSVNAQITTKTYLMYERINGQSIDTTGKVTEELTLFMVRGIMTQTDSKVYTRDISIINNKAEKIIKWEMNSSGASIKINNQDSQFNGRIITNPFIDSELFNNREVEFLLLPIESGITLKQLNGRYTEFGGLNLGDTIVFGEIISYGKYKGLQETKINDSLGGGYHLTKYMSSKENNLVYVGPMNQFLLPISVDANNVITFNAFLAQFDTPATMIKSIFKLYKVQ